MAYGHTVLGLRNSFGKIMMTYTGKDGMQMQNEDNYEHKVQHK